MISAKLRCGHALSAEHDLGPRLPESSVWHVLKRDTGLLLCALQRLASLPPVSAKSSCRRVAVFAWQRVLISCPSRAVEGMDKEWQQRGRDRRSEHRAVSRAMEILGMYSHREAVAVRVVAAIWLRFSLKRLKLHQTWMRHAIWVGRIPDEEFEEC